MHSNGTLKQQAVSAAKRGDWQRAIELNEHLIELQPKSVDALNRLGIAYTQTGKIPEAKKVFTQALEIDKTNTIAKKNLDKIKDNHVPSVPNFNAHHFIEEPGKTKLVELHRLASRDVLESLSVGELCSLVLKKRYISVEIDRTYIGALPEDLSFRLAKLINSGNTYSCHIRSTSCKSCCVYLKESKRSKKNRNTHSFPLPKSAHSADVIEDPLSLREDVPFEIEDENEPSDNKTSSDQNELS